jgi:CheY-like chemotaxis protein
MFGAILIVDDHEAVRRGLRVLLSGRPEWRICGNAAGGSQGVEKAKALRPALVLLDVSLPPRGGLGVTRILGRDLPESKIVIISQKDPAVGRRQAQAAGAAAYIAKSDLAHQSLPTLDRIANRPEIEVKPQAVKTSIAALEWLAGGGEMSRLIPGCDWSQTPLGPIESWPQSLKTSLSICLASRFLIVLYWRPEYVVVYNDAYRAILGSKRPWVLGQRDRDCRAEICTPLVPCWGGRPIR